MRNGFASTLSTLCLQNAEPISWLQPLVVLAGASLLALCSAGVVGASAQGMCGCSQLSLLFFTIIGVVLPCWHPLCAHGPTLLLLAGHWPSKRTADVSCRMQTHCLYHHRVLLAVTSQECVTVSHTHTHTLYAPAPTCLQVCCPNTPGVCSSQHALLSGGTAPTTAQTACRDMRHSAVLIPGPVISHQLWDTAVKQNQVLLVAPATAKIIKNNGKVNFSQDSR